ncbi:MAG: UDP-3-O-[3-hydroxymyristoyl] N-acetylglucosamine deacetylase [Phycisphaerales bacterium]|nr:UDP-3-O-[3-hydroxymyristoyl] N-acetylglucosamine deacetylase [Phycisphaerales bacterium]
MIVPGVPRRTLARDARVSGVGLFTAAPAHCAIRPAEPGSGVLLRRIDAPDARPFPALRASLSDRPVHPAFRAIDPRCTTLGPPDAPDAAVATVEHLLSSLAGLGVTDALVEVRGPELPILDGSAAPFVRAILDAGLRDAGPPPAPITLRAPVVVEAGGAAIVAEPADAFSASYSLDYGPGAPIPPQRAAWSGDPAAYTEQIAPARTFCLRAEAEAMRAVGLFAHLTPRDMLVIDASGPIDNTLRFPDEPARHKLLDLIGDLALLGRPLLARVRAERSGHALTHRLTAAILEAAI